MSEAADSVKVLVALDGGSLAIWRQVTLMQSPSYRVLTRSGFMALSRIEIALAAGRHHVRHVDFQKYGIARDSISHAVAEITGLGLVRVKRRGARANSFEMSDKWRGIGTIAEARKIRDASRDFGLFRRRKRERKLAAMRRAHQPVSETPR
jgi:hypothetical protein